MLSNEFAATDMALEGPPDSWDFRPVALKEHLYCTDI